MAKPDWSRDLDRRSQRGLDNGVRSQSVYLGSDNGGQVSKGPVSIDEQLEQEPEHFYTWRHTVASHLAASSKDPMLVMRVMGDTQLSTVMKHYFDSEFEHMQAEVEKWQLPVEKKSATRREARVFESAIESDPN